MVLDGALADAQVVSDDLVRTSSNHEVQDVALPRRQAGEPLGCRLAPLEKLSRIPDALERASDARQKLVRANGLFQKVGGSRLHRLDRHRNVAMAGDHNRWQATVLGLQSLQQSDSTHAWHQGIGYKASFPIRPVDREIGRAHV